MKLQLLSDLHLETQPHFRAQPLPGVDLTVLAGDIGSYQSGSQLVGDHFGLEQFSPQAGWPNPVVFVPGNHEYDALDWDTAHQRLQESCNTLGIQWLERGVLQQAAWRDSQGLPVRLLGTTLWTDFDALAPSPREKAYRAANYYLQKTGATRGGEPFLAEQIRDHALACQAWLRQALQTPWTGSTVVVTHFAPSLKSADPRYGLSPGTAGFCNGLDELLAGVQVWMHGHLHAPSDYVEAGCRVVANPLGYARKNEQVGYQPQLRIDV